MTSLLNILSLELLWYIQMETLNRQQACGSEVQGKDLTTKREAWYRTTARLGRLQVSSLHVDVQLIWNQPEEQLCTGRKVGGSYHRRREKCSQMDKFTLSPLHGPLLPPVTTTCQAANFLLSLTDFILENHVTVLEIEIKTILSNLNFIHLKHKNYSPKFLLITSKSGSSTYKFLWPSFTLVNVILLICFLLHGVTLKFVLPKLHTHQIFPKLSYLPLIFNT